MASDELTASRFQLMLEVIVSKRLSLGLLSPFQLWEGIGGTSLHTNSDGRGRHVTLNALSCCVFEFLQLVAFQDYVVMLACCK